MFKKLLVASATIALLASPGFAADLPVKAPPVAAPLPSWAGFYIGVNGGGDWSNTRTGLDVTSSGSFFGPGCFTPIQTCQVNVADVQRAGAQRLDSNGFTGGAQVGYNWQAGPMVYGLESDFNYLHSAASGLSTVTLVSGLPGTVTVGQSASAGDWLFTFRGRLGFLATPTWLVYGTGGVAVTDVRAAWTFTETRFNNLATSAFSNTAVGWTAGLGAETMLGGGWRLGLEYLYVNFGSSSSAAITLPIGGGPVPQNFRQTVDFSSNIVRLKLNYAFNTPLVAKY